MRSPNPFIIAAVLTGLALPASAFASMRSVNEAEADMVLTDGPDWYRYGTGADLAIDPDAGDVYDDTLLSPLGAVELDLTAGAVIPGAAAADAAVPWWNDDWSARTCSTVSGSGVQYVDVEFDSSSPGGWAANGWIQSDYGDLVPVTYDGTTTATAPFWLATPFDGFDGHAFVEVDFSSASPQQVCLYFGHVTGGQASASDPQLGQNWTGLRAVYERINPRYSSTTVVVSNPTLAPVTVANNPAGVGSTVIAPGGVVTVPIGPLRTIYADGAVITRGPNPGLTDESLTPLFHQGTHFVSATNRSRQNWCFAGAHGTSITIDPSSGAAVTFPLTPATRCREVDTTAHTVITSSAPVSVFHVTHNRQDPHVLYQATDDPLYGTPSAWLKLGVTAAGDVEFARSDSASLDVALGPLGYQSPNLGGLGAAPAHRVTPLDGQLLGGIQQRDNDGTDSSTFLPVEAMSSRYVLPLASTYTAIACPKVDDTILVDGVGHACAASGGGEVGKLLLGATLAGVVIESASGSAFHLYYHPPHDETSVFIPRFEWAQIESAPAPIQSRGAEGTWTATRSATTDVWGLFDATTLVPAGTAIEWEVACAATPTGPFTYGPIEVGDPVPHACDPFDVMSVRATLSTTVSGTTPSVESASIGYDLVAETEHIVTRDLTETGRTWLWRVHDGGSGEYAALTTDLVPGATSSGIYLLGMIDAAMNVSSQITATGGGMVDSGGPDVQLHVSSIVADTAVLPGAADSVEWVTTSGPSIARTIVID